MADLATLLSDVLPADALSTGDAINDDYTHDEAIATPPQAPAIVARPASTDEVAALLRTANEHRIPVTARGAGTGLCGAAIPQADSILVSTERMNAVLEIDIDNHVAVVQPGVTLNQLDEATRPYGLVYPISPGELTSTLGGNVATNAGGMRAVKYGVTRNLVLGLEAVLATGEVIRTGGKFVKATTGYDLTQLIVGSEGTLAIVTEITVKLFPRLDHQATLLAPFATIDDVAKAVPSLLKAGLAPLMLEYIDALAMEATTSSAGLDLGISQALKEAAQAYLVVVLESANDARLDEDVEEAGELLGDLGALDIFVLPPGPATALLDAREKAFWVAKAMGVNDIIDVVVPRASIPEYLATLSELASAHEAWIAGAGHAGDGNVHLSVFLADDEKRKVLMTEIFRAGMDLGGVISAEHGIGQEKKPYFLALEDPTKVALQQRIKAAFDPHGILNPGILFDPLGA